MTRTSNSKAGPVLRVLWSYLRPYRLPYFSVLFMITLATMTDVFIPVFYKRFFDTLTNGQQDDPQKIAAALLAAVTGVLILHGIGWVIWRAMTQVNNWLQSRVMADIAQSAHIHLHKHSYTFFADNFAGSLVRKAGRIERAYERLTDEAQFKFLPLVVIIAGNLIVLSTRHLMLAVILLIWIVVFLAFNTWFSIWKSTYDNERVALDSEATGVLADSVTNAIAVKLFTGMEIEKSMYRDVTERLRKMQRFTWNLGELIDAVQVGLMFLIEYVIFYYAIKYYQQGLLTIGDFALIQGYLVGMFGRLWDFGRSIRHSYEAIADASVMVEIMNDEPEVVDVRNAKTLLPEDGHVEFQNVFFSFHKTRRILRGFNLSIEPGEKIALVGPSGAGKSTITKLLLRFYDIERGKILIDGQDISRVTQESLRANIAMVPQEPVLFHRTIMENIRYGRLDATDEEVFEAAMKARCHDFIMELQDGYKTYVGERGVKLSGGERQRIAIARAILKDAPILVLDEATSSLDSESESLIQEALHELMKGKTSIAIAHRLSTIMNMDRIVVIEDGLVSDTGTHTELLRRRGGTYKRLWEIQTSEYVD